MVDGGLAVIASNQAGAVKSSFIGDLRIVLGGSGFRRLFATRLISQAGDGVFTAGLGSYVFFNATTYPNPASGAAAFAVLYLPYSLVGPFAGVFIDRWSRRQILVWSALVRAAFVALAATLVGSGVRGLLLYAASLLVLGVNRFFLASLSASLPHVVPEHQLVMANGVSPTAGGIMSAIGGFAALGVHVLTGGGRFGSAMTMVAAGCCYLLAAGAGATMSRDLLGPTKGPADAGADRRAELAAIGAAMASVAIGLAAGARYVLRRRSPTAALGATGANKLLYGILFLMAILLYRNYFYPHSADVALGHFTWMVFIPGAVGYGIAGLVTPSATARISKQAWISVALALAGVLTGALGSTFAQIGFLIVALGVNLAAQSVAISAVTILQEEVEDNYRGRVFAFYDMMSNIPFVIGAALSALFMPLNGKSYPIIVGIAAGYLIASGCYWAVVRRPSARRAGITGGTGGQTTPSASAQRSSS
jgi:MFS family permease